MELMIGPSSISAYKRLSYKPWYAIAELVDNSTQSYFSNRETLDAVSKSILPPLQISIEYSHADDYFEITDNALGMSENNLKEALIVAFPPLNPGRSKYGMGLKTACCWIGDIWEIETAKLGSGKRYKISVDVDAVSKGVNDINLVETSCEPDLHYTTVRIFKHNQIFKTQTIKKIGIYLALIYRRDIQDGILQLKWRDEILVAPDIKSKLLQLPDGKPATVEFNSSVACQNGQKNVKGWIGILERGQRSSAGFSIFQHNRVIRTWPDNAWRPESVFGEHAPNDLINQRVVGEIDLDEFAVSHTKDDILWDGDDEYAVGDFIAEIGANIIDTAREYRVIADQNAGPSPATIRRAFSIVDSTIKSDQFHDLVKFPRVPSKMAEDLLIEKIHSRTEDDNPYYHVEVAGITIKVFLKDDGSISDPYFVVLPSDGNIVLIVINTQHPHWFELNGFGAFFTFLIHCIFDGVSEYIAKNQRSTVTYNTFRMIKDSLLRSEMIIEERR